MSDWESRRVRLREGLCDGGSGSEGVGKMKGESFIEDHKCCIFATA